MSCDLHSSVVDQVAELEAEGYRVLQWGAVIHPFDPKVKRSSSERFADFNASAVVSGDKLLDDDERWAHLRLVPKDAS